MKISCAKREQRGEVKGRDRLSIKNTQWKRKELKDVKIVTICSHTRNTKQAASELPRGRTPRMNEG